MTSVRILFIYQFILNTEKILPGKTAIRRIGMQVYDHIKSLLASDRSQVGGKFHTSRELAIRFGVSLGTAQAALRRLEEEGYISCLVGRGTYIKRTIDVPVKAAAAITFGVLAERRNIDLHDPKLEWTSTILYGFQQGLMEHGHALKAIPFYDAYSGEIEGARENLLKLAPSLSGLLVFPFLGMEKCISTLNETDIPWITVNQIGHAGTSNFVSADYYGAGLQVGKLFGELGFKRVLYMRTDSGSYSESLREHGLRDGLLACGGAAEIQVVNCEQHLVKDGMNAMDGFLRKSGSAPQGVFASGDLLAMGAIRACQEHNLQVPEQVAVVGSTGIEAGCHFNPSLTTVSLPMLRMGIEAAHMLDALTQEKSMTTPGIILPVEFLERGSTPRRPSSLD